jgi:hypothetical protein
MLWAGRESNPLREPFDGTPATEPRPDPSGRFPTGCEGPAGRALASLLSALAVSSLACPGEIALASLAHLLPLR